MKTLNTLLAYRELGWSVGPAYRVDGDKSKSKRPFGKWKEFQTRIATVEELTASTNAYIEKYGNEPNIFLFTGKVSGISVLDYDSYKENAKDLDISSPVTSITGSGGKHLFFKYSDSAGTFVDEKNALDGRSTGAGVILSPSVHGNGKKYQWENISTLAELKKALKDLPDYPVKKVESIVGVPAPTGEYLNRDDVVGIAKGGRDVAMYKLCCSLHNDVVRGRLEFQSAFEMARATNATYNPPLDNRQLYEKWSAAEKFVASNPPHKTISASVATKPEVKSVQENKVENIEFKEQSNSEREVMVIDQIVSGSKLGIETKYRDLNNITGGLFPGESCLIFAYTNVGKTCFALNLIVDLAKKEEMKTLIFDLENDEQKTDERILKILEGGDIKQRHTKMDNEIREVVEPLRIKNKERKKSGLSPVEMTKEDKERLTKMTKEIYAPRYKLSIRILHTGNLNDRFGHFGFDEIEKVILEEVEKKDGARLFLIDHLHYFDPSETDHNKLADVSRRINNLCVSHNIIIISIYQTAKNMEVVINPGKEDEMIFLKTPTLDDISGSGKISANAKTVIGLHRNERARTAMEKASTTVHVLKTKYGPLGEFPLTFNPDTLIFSDGNEEREATSNFNDDVQTIFAETEGGA